MNAHYQITIDLHKWVSLAFEYQLNLNGPINVSRLTNQTCINNEVFSLFGLKYVSSDEFKFDRGIELNFEFINQIGDKLSTVLGHSKITVTRHNLESTDGEHRLEKFLITNVDDLDLLSCRIDLSDKREKVIDQLHKIISDYLNSDEIKKLRTVLILRTKTF